MTTQDDLLSVLSEEERTAVHAFAAWLLSAGYEYDDDEALNAAFMFVTTSGLTVRKK